MTYSVGTITLTNGSRVVTGVGTKFVANVMPGFLLIPVGGAAAVIAEVNSDTQLTLARPWVAATMNGTGYDIVETSGGDVDLSLRALAILNSFGAVRDGVGQGLFPAGSVTTPSIRGINDQDTGLRWTLANTLALVTAGADRITIDFAGRVGIGTSNPYGMLDVASADQTSARLGIVNTGQGGRTYHLVSGINGITNVGFSIYDASAGQTRAVMDADGNLLVGVLSGSAHVIKKAGALQGSLVLSLLNDSAGATAHFYGVGNNSWNAAGAAMVIGANNVTNRSINAPGTLNAGGADYAEYMLKAAGCGLIAKGDVCGVDRDGRLTKTWVDAISFVIKSTDPALVGGDTWDADVAPKPEEPGAEPIEPAAPFLPGDADDAAAEAYREAMAAYPGLIGAYRAEHAAWTDAMAAYAVDLKAWEAAHEKARQCVDRIAFCGQVPANVSGDFEVGDYVIAAASGAGIKAVAVKADDMTLPQYMRRIGKVWAVRDGRAWIDVQHG